MKSASWTPALLVGLVGLTAIVAVGAALAVRGAAGPTDAVVGVVDASLPEGDAATQPLLVTVRRTGDDRAAVLVRWALVPGSATPGKDYVPARGLVRLPAGAAVAAVPVRIRGDRLREGDETVRVRIVSAEGARVGRRAAVAGIADDDGAGGPLVVAVGDAACDPADAASTSDTGCAHVAVARTALGLDPVAVLGLGDLQYPRGTEAAYRSVFVPAWRPLLPRVRPVPGNHEYGTPGAAGYHAVFGAAAGTPARTWSSFDIGSWHVVALDSNCDEVGGCAAGSRQERWLRADLAAHPRACVLAYWHHPRFGSGDHHGGSDVTADLWRALDDAGADVVVTGHEHVYESLGPLGPTGEPTSSGLRSFVVGTGGAPLYGFGTPVPGSRTRLVAHGVLALRLGAGRVTWSFHATDGRVHDRGTARCR